MADTPRHDVARLLVDGRPVCHPTAGQRGIGHYTLGLLGGLQQVGAPVIALYETAAEAALLGAAIPDLALQQLDPVTVREHTEPGTWFVATQLMLHPIPLDPVPRIITESGLPAAAVMYDVIPERYPQQYQMRSTARAQVQLRGILTRTLDALLAISDFAADTAAHELRFPRDRVTTIGAGRDQQFKPSEGDPWMRLRNVIPNVGPDDNRLLVVNVAGGSDPRKNVERLLHAWGAVPPSVRRRHRLLIVGSAERALLEQWKQWAVDARVVDDVAFTGSVTDDELVALHQVARLAVVPSTEEGFGLPVLEAAACGCPVLTSNVSALPEVLAEPAAQFDPFDVASISTALIRALTDVNHRDVLVAAAARAAERWTWTKVGRAVVDSLQRLGPRKQRTLRPVRQRVAMTGRFDDAAIGRLNSQYATTMRDRAEVTILVDHAASDDMPTHAGPLRFPAGALGRYVHRSQFDEILTLPVDP